MSTSDRIQPAELKTLDAQFTSAQQGFDPSARDKDPATPRQRREESHEHRLEHRRCGRRRHHRLQPVDAVRVLPVLHGRGGVGDPAGPHPHPLGRQGRRRAQGVRRRGHRPDPGPGRSPGVPPAATPMVTPAGSPSSPWEPRPPESPSSSAGSPTAWSRRPAQRSASTSARWTAPPRTSSSSSRAGEPRPAPGVERAPDLSLSETESGNNHLGCEVPVYVLGRRATWRSARQPQSCTSARSRRRSR